MKKEIKINDAAIDALRQKLQREGSASGYHLNIDREFVRELVRSLLVNQQRYGYPACPCRLATGDKAADLDIICPCDYRDADLNEFGACFCALYVGQEVMEGRKQAASIPERRPPASERRAARAEISGNLPVGKLSQPVWRCKVCGYLCARGEPPDTCPICKAKKDRFERFL
ncbi:MAG: ferredoxin:glutaredoxin reductase [Candidatus Aminicenantes bacterium]|nr:ferredoxin:glutaredoxin reductase [Candidatus Aminicenantes bacterium]